MDPTPLFAILMKLYDLRGQIAGEKSKCWSLIDRCLSLKPSLERLSCTKSKSKEALQNLKKLEELLETCFDLCGKFCGKGWIRSAIEVIRNSTLFDELHQELTVLSQDLHLEIAICQRNSQLELMEMVASIKQFIDVLGLDTLKSSPDLQNLMRSSLAFSEMASVTVDENRATMKLETLNMKQLRYEKDKESELGRGGFGTVYRGKYGKDRAAVDVAVKVLASIEERDQLKLTREVRVMGKAQHQNVIKMFGYSVGKGLIVMELACCCLYDVLAGQQHTTLPETYLQSMSDVLSCFSDVLSGLRYLHYHDIVHRDLKPQNILLALDTCSKTVGDDVKKKLKVVAKISDFGLATMASLSASRTGNGPLGSLPYVSPELFNEVVPVYSDKSDIYALGICFNEVLTRISPYPAGWPPAKILEHVGGGKRPASNWHCQYTRDDELAAAIGDGEVGCLHQDPKMRPGCDVFLKMIKSKLKLLLPSSSSHISDQTLDQMIFTSVERMTLRPSDSLKDLAHSGYAPAQNAVGVSAIKEGDFADAFQYFRLAADESHYHPAEFNLGCCYEEGKGTEVNRETAVSYFRLSAEASFPPALYKLGLFHESLGEVQRAMELYRSGAELNHAPCQFKFGYLHETINDYAVVSQYYQKAAAQDFSPAQHHLALLYLSGKASPPSSPDPSSPSVTDAVKSLLLSAAFQDYPPSHFILATELRHDPFLHLEKAAALRYEPALFTLKKSRDGSVWSEGDCEELSEPDFPVFVPLAVAPVHPSDAMYGDDESKGDTSRGYALVSSGDFSVPLGISFEITIAKEDELPKTAEDYLYYFHHLLVCLVLCIVSIVLLVTSLDEEWGESVSNRRMYLSSNAHSSTVKRSLRVGALLPDPATLRKMLVLSNVLDSDTDINFPRRLSSSVSWPSYLSAPGEAVLTLCPGHTLDVSMCSTSLDSNIACSGDPVLTLLDSSGTSTVVSNDDFCGNCPSLLYTIPSTSSCSNYVLRASCYNSGICSGKALLTVTTSTCSQTFADRLSSSSNSYPVLSCTVLENNKDSLANFEGQWTILDGGSVQNQCGLRGSGYGVSYRSSWSSTSDRRFYLCANEANRPSVSLVTGSTSGSFGTSNGIGTNAQFYYPYGISLSSDGSFALVSDTWNQIIRKIVISISTVSVVAGGGPSSSGMSNGIGTTARFNNPFGVTLSSDGSFALVGDHGNNMIRKIVMSTSTVSVVAGAIDKSSGTSNGIGTNARFYWPFGVTLSSDGSFALVGDNGNNMIRKIVMSTSTVTLVAGAIDKSSGTSNGIGTNARFSGPAGVSLSSDGSYALVADSNNHQIRKIVIATSTVTLVAGGSGTSNGIGSSAKFSSPLGVTLSSDSSFALVTDTENHMIRKIVMSTSAVSLLAGTSSSGASNGFGTNAKFYNPLATTLSSDGSSALVADSYNHMIRKIVLSSPAAIGAPTRSPSLAPTRPPSLTPTGSPSLNPTGPPSLTPTGSPSLTPTGAPSISFSPTLPPSLTPTGSPSLTPTGSPSLTPTGPPSLTPTLPPSLTPTGSPSLAPTRPPSLTPTRAPSLNPTGSPSLTPTASPSISFSPTGFPSIAPTSQTLFSSFLVEDTRGATSTSLSFTLLAMLVVVCRILTRLQIRPSPATNGPLKLFAVWWWVGYLCCCGISAVCAVTAVASYAEALSEEFQGRYLTGFYLCLVSILTNVGALFATPEVFLWMWDLDPLSWIVPLVRFVQE